MPHRTAVAAHTVNIQMHTWIFMIKAIKLPTGSNYHINSHLFHTPTCSSTVQGYFWLGRPDFTFKGTSRLVSGLKELGTLGKWICEVRQRRKDFLTESFILIFQPCKCMFYTVRETKGSSGQSYKSHCWVKHTTLFNQSVWRMTLMWYGNKRQEKPKLHPRRHGVSSVWSPVMPKRPAPVRKSAPVFPEERDQMLCLPPPPAVAVRMRDTAVTDCLQWPESPTRARELGIRLRSGWCPALGVRVRSGWEPVLGIRVWSGWCPALPVSLPGNGNRTPNWRSQCWPEQQQECWDCMQSSCSQTTATPAQPEADG